jgi:hypothetical protein
MRAGCVARAILACAAAVAAQGLNVAAVVESLAIRYDRILSYHADADVFEYSS